jgi:D-sedoheptulose 7-phosphate isomerase
MIKFSSAIKESISVKKQLIKLEKKINYAIDMIFNSINNSSKILICGNGGSAADAQHLSAEFVDRLRPSINRNPMPILSLALDTSHLTACSNDFSFDDVFVRPLEAFGKESDILIVISTSGNSKNIIKVLKKAKKMNIKSIALLGYQGGDAKKYADNSIIVKSNNTARIQESHIFLGHFILESVERKILENT